MPKKTKTYEYTPKDAEELFKAMALGETLRAFCRNKKIPHSTCIEWMKREYPDQYARAREDLAHFWADEIIDISDDVTKDYKLNSKGEKVVDNEAIQRSKLKVETRKWLLSKIAPKEFGEKMEVSGKVDTGLPPEIAEMIANMKKGDKEEDDESPQAG